MKGRYGQSRVYATIGFHPRADGIGWVVRRRKKSVLLQGFQRSGERFVFIHKQGRGSMRNAILVVLSLVCLSWGACITKGDFWRLKNECARQMGLVYANESDALFDRPGTSLSDNQKEYLKLKSSHRQVIRDLREKCADLSKRIRAGECITQDHALGVLGLDGRLVLSRHEAVEAGSESATPLQAVHLGALSSHVIGRERSVGSYLLATGILSIVGTVGGMIATYATARDWTPACTWVSVGGGVSLAFGIWRSGVGVRLLDRSDLE